MPNPAVDDELPSNVRQDFLRATQTFQACDALKPRVRYADDVAKFGWHLYIVDDGGPWCGANNPVAMDDLPLGFGSDERLFGLGLRRRSVRGWWQNPSPASTGTEPLTDRLDTQSDFRALELLRLTDALVFAEESTCAS